MAKKYKKLKKSLREYGGAGFAYNGASMSTSRPGGINKGGFGGAANLGGPNMMYTYEIKPLNRDLQPDMFSAPEVEEIKIGNDISGYQLNKRDGILHIGPLLRIEKAPNGSLMHYIILDPETATRMKIDPTTCKLVSKLDGVDPLDIRLGRDQSELMRPDIKKEDKTMRARTVKECLNEGTLNYEEFTDEISDIMKSKGVSQKQIDDSLDYFHGKGYLEDYFQEGYPPIEAYTEIKQMSYYTSNEYDKKQYAKYQEEGSRGENFE